MEIEAKYRVASRAALDRLAATRRARDYVLDAKPEQRLRTIYLDTPDLELVRSHAALRIRRTGRKIEATVKAGGDVRGEIHRRSEWNVPLEAMPSFPYHPPPSIRRRLPRSCRDAAFEPVLETRIRRRIRLARHGRGPAILAEIALDDVEFRSPNARSRHRDFELEIELRRGSESDLRRLAAALGGGRRLRASSGSKLERGLRWAVGATARGRMRGRKTSRTRSRRVRS